jgi:hypothetical protein
MTHLGTQFPLFESVDNISIIQTEGSLPISKSAADTLIKQPETDNIHTSRFSDYIVYVDESGDHSLASIDKGYPVFVLALCVFHKRHYSEKIIPAIEKLKFNYFGHDNVVLHENEIRKQKGHFAFLSHLATRHEFMSHLSHLIDKSNFILIACVVDKARLNRNHNTCSNPYHIALDVCLESLHNFLVEKGQTDRKTHIIVECRGKKEDTELKLEFRRISDNSKARSGGFPFEILFADKKTNLDGLQLADLVARPVGINYLRPTQKNQAFDILKKKFYCEGGRERVGGKYKDVGLKIFPPIKAKSPSEPTEASTPTGNPQSIYQ